MSLFVFNNQQKLIKSIPNRDLISVVQDQAINVSDTLFVEMPADIWSNLKEPAPYLAVQDPYERFSYHMYKVSKHTTKADTVDVEAIQVGYDELKAYGYIKDRRFNNRPVLEAATAIVDGTDWQLGYVDTDLPNVYTNFYYISRLEALSKLIEATGAEVRFRVEISGNKIIAKRLDLYKQLGTFKGKRFAYGSNLLEIVKEEDTSELYTALVGRGKGEETDTGGFGRRITFADIAWSKANGKPADKPLGQEFIELPEMTANYGYPDGEPRTGIVEFGDIEEPELLLKATYERLIETSRPQVQFKAKVQATGDMQLGEEVAIIRSDLGFRYKTRVFRVKRDYLNNMFTEVELGDKLTETLASRIKKIDTTNARREETIIQYIQTAANGKNKIFRGEVEPTEGMMVNDLWYKPVGEGETMLYTWNGEIWELSKVSAGLLAGTLDAENGDVNVINLNAASIVSGTFSGLVFFNDWSISGMTGTTTLRGDLTSNYTMSDGKTGQMAFSRDRVFSNLYNADGSLLRGYNLSPEAINFNSEFATSTYNYDNIHVTRSDGTNSNITYAYSNFPMQLTSEKGVRLGISVNGVRSSRLEVGGSGSDAFVSTSGELRMNGGKLVNPSEISFSVSSRIVPGENFIEYRAENIQSFFLSGFAAMYLTRNDNTGEQVADLYAELNMQGNAITNQSDIRLKSNVSDSDFDALKEIERMKFIDYEWDLTNPYNKQKPRGRQFGIVAQYSPFLQTKSANVDSYLSVDMTKQVNLNSKAIQELLNRIKALEAKI